MDNSSKTLNSNELQERLQRRMAWAFVVYSKIMEMQGKEWQGIRSHSSPEEIAQFVLDFKTNGFRTFIRQITNATSVKIAYYDLDIAQHSAGDLKQILESNILSHDHDYHEHTINLPTAWLTSDYSTIYKLLNPALEQAIIALWKEQGCPDAPQKV
jgi:hypothetical protein